MTFFLKIQIDQYGGDWSDGGEYVSTSEEDISISGCPNFRGKNSQGCIIVISLVVTPNGTDLD